MNNSALLFNISRLLGKGLFNTVFNLKIEGRENISVNKQYILISNHLNWSDPFYLYIIFPAKPRLIFVAEYEGIYDNKYKKNFIDLMGKPILPIDRDDPISPVAIAGSKELSFRKTIHIRIGELIYCHENDTDEQFARRSAKAMQNLIPEYPGDGPFPDLGNWMTGLCQGELRDFEGERDLIISKISRKKKMKDR